MRPVEQTIFHDDLEGRVGNCLQACVASVLELELGEVPHFIVAENWLEQFHTFMERKKYTVNKVPGKPHAGMGIGVGPSPRDPAWSHAVVVENGCAVWDPHPSHRGLDEFDYTWLLEKK